VADIPTGFLSKGGIRSFRAKPIKAIYLREKHLLFSVIIFIRQRRLARERCHFCARRPGCDRRGPLRTAAPAPSPTVHEIRAARRSTRRHLSLTSTCPLLRKGALWLGDVSSWATRDP